MPATQFEEVDLPGEIEDRETECTDDLCFCRECRPGTRPGTCGHYHCLDCGGFVARGWPGFGEDWR